MRTTKTIDYTVKLIESNEFFGHDCIQNKSNLSYSAISDPIDDSKTKLICVPKLIYTRYFDGKDISNLFLYQPSCKLDEIFNNIMSREMIAKKNLETILSITSPEFSKEYKSRQKDEFQQLNDMKVIKVRTKNFEVCCKNSEESSFSNLSATQSLLSRISKCYPSIKLATKESNRCESL